jgi:hypothetical protein
MPYNLLAVDLDAELARLYQLPLDEFVKARNALAKEAGDASIKKLAKPSVAAWTVNQVYYGAPEQCEALLQIGDRLLGLQRSGDRDAIAEATARKRSLLAELARLAGAILTEAGHGTGAATVRKVQTALDALGTYGSQQPAPGWGRLAADLGPPGFAELAELAANAPEVELPERTAPVEIPEQPEPDEDEDEPDEPEPGPEPEIDLSPYREAVDGAVAELEATRKEAAEALIELESLSRQLAAAQTRATEAHQAVNTATGAVASARAALADAEGK